MNLKKFAWSAFGLLLTMSIFESCQKSDLQPPPELASKSNQGQDPPGFVNDDMVIKWNENLTKVMSKFGFPPPVVSRPITMTQIAVHDALNSIKPKYKTYALQNMRMKNANPDAAVASAAYWTLTYYSKFLVDNGLSPLPLQTSGNDWNGWYKNSLDMIADGEEEEAGIALGKLAAEAIMNNRADDQYKTAARTFAPARVPNPILPGDYRPTVAEAPYPQNIMGLPFWGTTMRAFVLTSNDQFRPAAPPAVNSDLYTAHFNEVKSVGAEIDGKRTEDQAVYANFWWESFSLIWNRFCRNTVSEKKQDAWKTARLFALNNIAMFDAALASFDGLYHYYRWRPETAIRLAADDGNTNTAANATWFPFVTDILLLSGAKVRTPPIPEYPSPQAGVGNAAVSIFQQFYGTDNSTVSLTSENRYSGNVPARSYSSFSAVGRENTNSLLYGGFHFRYSLEAGNALGDKVGDYIFDHVLQENEE